MTKTYEHVSVQTIPHSREEVFAFFSNAQNLERITPTSLGFEILTPQPIEMAAGTLIDYRLRLFGLPMRWRTRIESFEPPLRFVDTQLRGPYKRWHHTHEFEEIPGGTRMTDRVRYQIPLGPLGRLAGLLFVHRTVRQIFAHRRQQIDTLLGTEPALAETPGEADRAL